MTSDACADPHFAMDAKGRPNGAALRLHHHDHPPTTLMASLVMPNIAIENGPFIVSFPGQNGDFL